MEKTQRLQPVKPEVKCRNQAGRIGGSVCNHLPPILIKTVSTQKERRGSFDGGEETLRERQKPGITGGSEQNVQMLKGAIGNLTEFLSLRQPAECRTGTERNPAGQPGRRMYQNLFQLDHRRNFRDSLKKIKILAGLPHPHSPGPQVDASPHGKSAPDRMEGVRRTGGAELLDIAVEVTLIAANCTLKLRGGPGLMPHTRNHRARGRILTESALQPGKVIRLNRGIGIQRIKHRIVNGRWIKCGKGRIHAEFSGGSDSAGKFRRGDPAQMGQLIPATEIFEQLRRRGCDIRSGTRGMIGHNDHGDIPDTGSCGKRREDLRQRRNLVTGGNHHKTPDRRQELRLNRDRRIPAQILPEIMFPHQNTPSPFRLR